MEVIRMAANDFYEGGPIELKQYAVDMFRRMDSNGDGWISIEEFQHFLINIIGYTYFNPYMFFVFDMDQNGFLDFDEFKVFFYVTERREEVWPNPYYRTTTHHHLLQQLQQPRHHYHQLQPHHHYHHHQQQQHPLHHHHSQQPQDSTGAGNEFQQMMEWANRGLDIGSMATSTATNLGLCSIM